MYRFIYDFSPRLCYNDRSKISGDNGRTFRIQLQQKRKKFRSIIPINFARLTIQHLEVVIHGIRLYPRS